MNGISKITAVASRCSSTFRNERMNAYNLTNELLAKYNVTLEQFKRFANGNKYAESYFSVHEAIQESLRKEYEAVNAACGIKSARKVKIEVTKSTSRSIGLYDTVEIMMQGNKSKDAIYSAVYDLLRKERADRYEAMGEEEFKKWTRKRANVKMSEVRNGHKNGKY